MQFDSVVFDLDGTLWDANAVVLETWNGVLSGTGYEMSAEKLSSLTGQQFINIVDKLFPGLDEASAKEWVGRFQVEECRQIRKRGGVLYDGLEETLERLSANCPLFIVSNCHEGYIEAFLEFHGLTGLFKDWQCAGSGEYTKGENIQRIMKRNGLQASVYVGDTQSDCDSAAFAGVPFVFASYGFGKADQYLFKIDKPMDLLQITE